LADQDVRLRLGGITDMSTIDWYGNVSMVVFWAGCNIKCPYCHNSTLIPMDSGTEVGLSLLDERLRQSMNPVPSLDAVVLTGGEPILQADQVIEAARLVKKYGLLLMLDTNGTVFELVEKILGTGLIDRVALDVKAPLNPDSIGALTHVSELAEIHTDSIIKTLKLCKSLGIPVEARTTVAPGISDDEKYIRQIARDIKGYAEVYYLQQFDNQWEVLSPELKEMDPPSRESLISLAKAVVEEGVENAHIKTRFEGLERIE
jgi:pyruvate formate lyase activating enzyme